MSCANRRPKGQVQVTQIQVSRVGKRRIRPSRASWVLGK